MVNNIAANVLGGKPELEDEAEMEGTALISALRLAIKNALSWVCREKLLHLFAPLCLAAVCDWWGLSPCQQCWNCEAWQWKHVFDGFCSCACQNQTLPGCVCVCVCACPERAATKCCSNTHVAFLNAEVKLKNTLLRCIITINRPKEKRLFYEIFLQCPLRDYSRVNGWKFILSL